MVEWVKEHNPDITLIKDYHIYRPLPQDALYEVTTWMCSFKIKVINNSIKYDGYE